MHPITEILFKNIKLYIYIYIENERKNVRGHLQMNNLKWKKVKIDKVEPIITLKIRPLHFISTLNNGC